MIVLAIMIVIAIVAIVRLGILGDEEKAMLKSTFIFIAGMAAMYGWLTINGVIAGGVA